MKHDEIKVGARLTWLYTPKGGYGYTVPVDATVVKVGPERVKVEVRHLRKGLVQRWVRPEHLKPIPPRTIGTFGDTAAL